MTEDKTPHNDKSKEGSVKAAMTIASLGLTFVISSLIGAAAGYYADRYFGTAPWLMLVFLLFGIAAGFKNIYTALKKYGF